MHWANDPKELRKRRKESGVTQAHLCKAAGVKPSWLAAVETGRVPLDGPKGEAVWNALADLRRRQRAPEVKAEIEKLVDQGSKDWKEALRMLVSMSCSDSEVYSAAAESLFEERYATLDTAAKEWVAKEIDDQIHYAEHSDPNYPQLSMLSALVTRKKQPIATKASAVAKRLAALKHLRARKESLQPRETPDQAEIRKLRSQMRTILDELAITRRLADCQTELLALYKTESGEHTARVKELEQEVKDLRNLYEAETEAALANERAEQLREKLTNR